MAKRRERDGKYWVVEDTWRISVQYLYREACTARHQRQAEGDFLYDGGDLRWHMKEQTPGRIRRIHSNGQNWSFPTTATTR